MKITVDSQSSRIEIEDVDNHSWSGEEIRSNIDYLTEKIIELNNAKKHPDITIKGFKQYPTSLIETEK